MNTAGARSLFLALASSLGSVAQTSLHPANVVKTLLQTKGSFGAILPLTWATLSRGAGAQFLLSLPNGALHFAVLEVRASKAGKIRMHVCVYVGELSTHRTT